MVECDGCALLRLAPVPSAWELAEYYPARYWFAPGSHAGGAVAEKYRRIVLRDHVRFVLQALESTERNAPVLDVGCGGGLFGRMLAERGWRVFGLDQSVEAASLAWRINTMPVVCGELSQAPLARGRFAAVTMFHVLEHVYDPPAYISAARDLLARGGRLIVQVPNADCWQFRLFGSRWNGLDIPRHLTDFRAGDVRALLADCGLEVLREKQFSLRDNPAGLASSLAPALDPMARRIRGSGSVIYDAVYFALVLASLPFAIAEAACGAGSTVMIEARKPE
ncbi:MAG TPA: class I SAM-dependent methyltransferase [Bryobacteraceae bacterium]|nr:class I SAM-dependent methyltransferase [Bryobacteraceae bacterium]